MSQPSRFSVFTKWLPFSDTARVSVADGSASDNAEELEALAASEEPLQQDPEEMNFQDQFEPSEGRQGDAIAQVVAAVRFFLLRVNYF